jgi:NAD+ kinase
LVIPSHSEISVSVDLSDGEMAAIDLDGDDFAELSSEDILLIRASSNFIKLIHPENYDYFDVLRTKLY